MKALRGTLEVTGNQKTIRGKNKPVSSTGKAKRDRIKRGQGEEAKRE